MNLQSGTFNFLLTKKREREVQKIKQKTKQKQNQVLLPDP